MRFLLGFIAGFLTACAYLKVPGEADQFSVPEEYVRWRVRQRNEVDTLERMLGSESE